MQTPSLILSLSKDEPLARGSTSSPRAMFEIPALEVELRPPQVKLL
jgi:hypothetical protein